MQGPFQKHRRRATEINLSQKARQTASRHAQFGTAIRDKKLARSFNGWAGLVGIRGSEFLAPRLRLLETGKSGHAEPLQDLVQGEPVMSHDLAQDRAQGAGAKRVVVGNGEVMFPAGLRRKPAVRAELPDKPIVEGTPERLFRTTADRSRGSFTPWRATHPPRGAGG